MKKGERHIMKCLKCEKESEDQEVVVYRYTDLMVSAQLDGSFKIGKKELSVSTVKLPAYTKERIDEMRLAGKIIIEFHETGVWPKGATLG